jgi:hypothetical protein
MYRNNRLEGIPSSLVQFGSQRKFLSPVAIPSEVTQLITQLQSQIVDLRTRIDNLKNAQLTQLVSASKNLIANGAASIWSHANPMIATADNTEVSPDYWAISNTGKGMYAQQRAVPIMDRWYMYCDIGAMFGKGILGTPSVGDAGEVNFVMQGEQVQINVAESPKPSIATTALKMTWSHGGITDYHKPVADDNTYYQCSYGIYHRVPGVTQFRGRTFGLGFWVKPSMAGQKIFLYVYRQYNETTATTTSTTTVSTINLRRPPGCQRILLEEKTLALAEWQYVSVEFNVPETDLAGQTIDEEHNGLCICVGPMYMIQYYTNGAQATVQYGSGVNGVNGGTLALQFTEFSLFAGEVPTSLSYPADINMLQRTREYVYSLESTPNPERSPVTDESLGRAQNIRGENSPPGGWPSNIPGIRWSTRLPFEFKYSPDTCFVIIQNKAVTAPNEWIGTYLTSIENKINSWAIKNAAAKTDGKINVSYNAMDLRGLCAVVQFMNTTTFANTVRFCQGDHNNGSGWLKARYGLDSTSARGDPAGDVLVYAEIDSAATSRHYVGMNFFMNKVPPAGTVPTAFELRTKMPSTGYPDYKARLVFSKREIKMGTRANTINIWVPDPANQPFPTILWLEG